MKRRRILPWAVAMIAAASATATWGAGQASDADRTFIGKVSQGGLYEVEAGKVAAVKGTTPFVKNFGVLDTHDHTGVNGRLRGIAAKTGVAIQPGLNAEFTARLQKLKAVPSDQFDAYYVKDMQDIHNGDEALFVKEADEGSASYKDFAHTTAVLVKAHLGWLNSI